MVNADNLVGSNAIAGSLAHCVWIRFKYLYGVRSSSQLFCLNHTGPFMAAGHLEALLSAIIIEFLSLFSECFDGFPKCATGSFTWHYYFRYRNSGNLWHGTNESEQTYWTTHARRHSNGKQTLLVVAGDLRDEFPHLSCCETQETFTNSRLTYLFHWVSLAPRVFSSVCESSCCAYSFTHNRQTVPTAGVWTEKWPDLTFGCTKIKNNH